MRRRSELDSVYSYFVQATAFQSGRSKPMGFMGASCIAFAALRGENFQRWRFLS
jgi:hypothetical protein